MKGSLKHYKGDTWHYVLTFDPIMVDDKKKYPQKKFTIKAENQDQAEIKAADIYKKAFAGRVEGDDPTLSDWLDLWYKDNVESWAYRTKDFYQTQINFIKPKLGLVKLSKLRPRPIREFLGGLQTQHTAAHVYRTLKAALNCAVKDDYITLDINPMVKIDMPKTTKKKPVTWNAEQINRFLKQAELHPRKDFYRVCLINFHTGMRINEILGLRWEDIDFKNEIISVANKVEEGTAGSNPVFGTPKGDKIRRILMTKKIKTELAKQQMEQNIVRSEAGDFWRDFGLVFTVNNGGPIDRKNLQDRFFNPIIAKLGLPKMRIHDMRHSAGTLLYDLGVPLDIIQEVLGHSSPTITKQLYLHSSIEIQKPAIQQLSKAIK
jgi:integrase